MKRQITDDILIDYLNGCATDTDRGMVEAWLEDEEHQKYFASLKELWSLTAVEEPAITQTETAWNQLMQRMETQQSHSGRISIRPRWLIQAAASFLLLAGIYAWWTTTRGSSSPVTVSVNHPVTQPVREEFPIVHQQAVKPVPALEQPPAAAVVENGIKDSSTHQLQAKQTGNTPVLATAHSKEEICNNTNCPLEICILQSLECDGATSTFSHCSVLAPDASGLLHYRSVNDTTEYCQAPVAEIRIKRLNTGETIVLNTETNVTAQEFFDYITGNKKGDIVAGIFDTDCNNHCIDQSIRIDNRLGMPIILQ